MNPWTTRALSLPLLITVAIAAVAFAASTQDDKPKDGPDVLFRDEFIDNLAGDWSITRHMGTETAENSLHAEWVLNHQFLQLHMKDDANPPQYEAIVLIGFNHAENSYVAHWCDVFGAAYSAIGRGKRDGDHIEFRFDYPDAPFFNTFTWDAAKKEWTMKGENSDRDGKRSLFMTDTARRK